MDDPQSLSVADVAALQRQLGNTAVQGILSRRSGAGGDASVTAPATSIDTAAPVATWTAPDVQRETSETEDDEQTTEAEPGTMPGRPITAGARADPCGTAGRGRAATAKRPPARGEQCGAA
jgi:hypothetical protein